MSISIHFLKKSEMAFHRLLHARFAWYCIKFLRLGRYLVSFSKMFVINIQIRFVFYNMGLKFL